MKHQNPKTKHQRNTKFQAPLGPCDDLKFGSWGGRTLPAPTDIEKHAPGAGARPLGRFSVRNRGWSAKSEPIGGCPVKRRKRRAPLTPEASNVNSHGCKPTVARAIAIRPRRGRTNPGSTNCSTLPGSVEISVSCSVGLHPRLFKLNPFGIWSRPKRAVQR